MRMIQKCLLTQISRNVEAYMDDIVVKSRKGSDLLTALGWIKLDIIPPEVGKGFSKVSQQVGTLP